MVRMRHKELLVDYSDGDMALQNEKSSFLLSFIYMPLLSFAFFGFGHIPHEQTKQPMLFIVSLLILHMHGICYVKHFSSVQVTVILFACCVSLFSIPLGETNVFFMCL